jgi:DNA-binding XRE family transcriptional regulator
MRISCHCTQTHIINKIEGAEEMARKIFKPTGKEIKHMLLDADMTQVELAKAMGVTVEYIREICRENRNAPKMRAKIKEYLDGCLKIMDNDGHAGTHAATVTVDGDGLKGQDSRLRGNDGQAQGMSLRPGQARTHVPTEKRRAV